MCKLTFNLFYVSLLTLLISYIPPINPLVFKPSGLTLVDQLRHDFLILESTLWRQLNQNGLTPTKEQSPEVGLIYQYELFGNNITRDFPHEVAYGLKAIQGSWAWARMHAELTGIYTIYETFKRFQPLQTSPGRIPSPQRAWEDLVDAILTFSKNVPELLQNVNELIVEEKVYNQVLKEIEGDMICDSQQSPQQILLNLYNTIAVTELKGYSMIQFSYMLLRIYGKGNFTKEAHLMRTRYEERTRQSIKAVQKAMETTSRDLWRCDPKKHVKGQTYEELTELLQGYLQNEVDLNPEGTCRESCSEYAYTKSHGCFQNLWCRQQKKCEGKIINCQFYDSDMQVCPAEPGSGRRYEYVEFENGKVLGRKQGCSRGTTSVDSWWRWLFWHCSYCMCLCDDPGRNSDRYFNMRPATSDIKNNMVVTGLRFAKHNRIIHLQIQEGRLLPRGNIDPESVHWVPVEDYKLTDRHVFNKQDYHTMNWESRALDLDDLIAEEGHLVTGVRFKLLGTHLNFEIYITPFNFVTGELVDPEKRSFWKDNPNTDASFTSPRKRLRLKTPDVPIRSPTPSIPDSKSDQYVEFVNTDFERDVAQTTVPFLDAQNVESLLPVPLSGAGIFHKGRENFGGFVAPKIITYDFSKHLSAGFPEESYNIGHMKPDEETSDLIEIVPAN